MASWLGLTGSDAPLDRDVVVVSPHLDDVVFSLGGAIAHASARGVRVSVLTVLAGDPESEQPAGCWDIQAGFQTAGQATRARRAEDGRACELVGARPVWLAYFDHQYERGGEDRVIRDEVVAAVGGSADVLLPGFPLMHEDHAWLVDLLEGAFDEERVGFYVEQPYASFWTSEPGDWPTGTEAERAPRAWRRPAAGVGDRLRKLRACRAYTSQLPLFQKDMLTRIFRYEARIGGESLAWARSTR